MNSFKFKNPCLNNMIFNILTDRSNPQGDGEPIRFNSYIIRIG